MYILPLILANTEDKRRLKSKIYIFPTLLKQFGVAREAYRNALLREYRTTWKESVQFIALSRQSKALTISNISMQ